MSWSYFRTKRSGYQTHEYRVIAFSGKKKRPVHITDTGRFLYQSDLLIRYRIRCYLLPLLRTDDPEYQAPQK